MKALLDENIDVRLKYAFKDTIHEVLTVKDMGWNGLKNGELLKAMHENEFDLLIAVDKNLPYQQNKESLTVSIFILDTHRNTLANLTPFVPLLLESKFTRLIAGTK